MKEACAFIVGIDTYDQLDWSTTGPCTNAIAITQWLLSVGVSPAAIHLFLETTDQSHIAALKSFKEKGVKCSPSANGNDIDTFWRNRLKQLAQEFSRLFIYWSGHGFADKDGSRIFICRDYKSDGLSNRVFNCSNALRFFRSPSFRGFAEQICLCDACAVHSNVLIDANKTPPDSWAAETNQVAFFATPEGEYAIDDDGVGAFTRVALDVLRDYKNWPDLNQFSEAMKSAFDSVNQVVFRAAHYRRSEEITNWVVGSIVEETASFRPDLEHRINETRISGHHDSTWTGVVRPRDLRRRFDCAKDAVDCLAARLEKNRVVIIVGDVLDDAVAMSRATLSKVLSEQTAVDPPDLFLAGSRLEQSSGRPSLVSTTLQHLNSAGGISSMPYQHLARLPVRTIVSLYPDPVLEGTLQTSEYCFRPMVSDSDLTVLELGSGNRELYLLGGSARFGIGLVLTWEDHRKLLARTNHLARGLRDRLASKDILLLHCDLKDWNLKQLFQQLTRHRPRKDGTVYIAGSDLNDSYWESLQPVVLDKTPKDLLRILAERRLPGAIRVESSFTTRFDMPAQRNVNPYKYLAYFEEIDANLFAGRQSEVERLAAEIRGAHRRVTVLCGRSGVGKTSLVKAGLIPYLERDGTFVTAYARFGEHPETSLLQAMRERLELPTSGPSTALAEELSALHLQDKENRLPILFLDQSEEAFIKLGQEVLDGFAHSLEQCLEDPEGVSRFVFVIREDFLQRLALLGSQVTGILESAFRLDDLTRENARLAIIEPAGRLGVRVEDGLAEAILDDLQTLDMVLPAHLQIVCDCVYRSCMEHGVMTLSAYKALGAAESILRSHLNKALEKVPGDLDLAAKSVLTALVTSERTKDLLSMPEIVGRSELDEATATSVLNDLIHRCRLVREVKREETRYELAHESLAASIASWLDSVAARTRETQDILHREVTSAKRNPGYLIPRDRLELIDSQHSTLYIDPPALVLVVASHIARQGLPAFWRARLDSISWQERQEALFIRPIRSSRLTIRDVLHGETLELLLQHPVRSLPADVEENIVAFVSQGSAFSLSQVVRVFASCRELKCLSEALLWRLMTFPESDARSVLTHLGDGLAMSIGTNACRELNQTPDETLNTAIFLAAELFVLSQEWPNSAALQRELLGELQSLCRSPDPKRSDPATAHVARLLTSVENLELRDMLPEGLSLAALQRSLLVEDGDNFSPCLQYLMSRAAPEDLVPILKHLDSVPETRRAEIAVALLTSGELGPIAVELALCIRPYPVELIRLACHMFVILKPNDCNKSSCQTLELVLLRLVESGEHLCLISENILTLNSPSLAEKIAERLPQMTEATARQLLALPWPNRMYVAAVVHSRCHSTWLREELLSQIAAAVPLASSDNLIQVARQSRELAREVMRILAITPETVLRLPRELVPVAELVMNSSDKQDPIAALTCTFTGIRCEDPATTPMVLSHALQDLFEAINQQTDSLTVIDIQIVFSAASWLAKNAGGVSKLNPVLKQHLLEFALICKDPPSPSAGQLGQILAFHPDPQVVVTLLRYGSALERLGVLEALREQLPHPVADVHAAVEHAACVGKNLLIRARACSVLTAWGNVKGVLGAINLLNRKSDKPDDMSTRELCVACVRVGAALLTISQLFELLSKKGTLHLLLQEVLKRGAEPFEQEPELLNKVLKTLAQLPKDEAFPLQQYFLWTLPSMRSALQVAAKRGTSSQRYQVQMILKESGTERHV